MTTMQTFKRDKRQYLYNESKSWLLFFVGIAALYIAASTLFAIGQDKLVIAVAVMLLMKLGDTLTTACVQEIRIDKDRNFLTWKEYSLLSGDKIKNHTLAHTTAILHQKAGKLFAYNTLSITLSEKKDLRLTERYGFKLETLAAMERLLT
jgi:hypothetical protein